MPLHPRIVCLLVRTVCLLALLAFGARHAAAQQRSLHGIVTDSAGAPIRDADVGIASLRRLTRTGEQGRFVFDKLPQGKLELSVRRLGYHPRIVHAVIAAPHDSVRITLVATPAALAGVYVKASAERRREGIEDFHRRRIRGVGSYITRDEILAFNTYRTSDVLRVQPGIRLVQLAGNMGVRFNSSSIVRRDCSPMIWLDGQRAPGLEIDQIPATDIEGIELYKGPSTTPAQFSQHSASSTCGTIVVWTRNPGN